MVAVEKTPIDSDIIETIEIPEAIVRLRRDGIVYTTFRKGIVLDLVLQAKLLEINIQITGGKKSCFIYDAEENVTITKEARDNAVKIEHLAPIKSTAAVANNLAYRLIANFYLHFNKPKTPYKVFDTFDNGIAWLKSLPD